MRELVLWGHHVEEYREMFDLSWSDFDKRILEYGCGPSAINSELNESTNHVVSCDPLFTLDKSTLFTKVSLIFDDMVANVKQDQDKFDFSRYNGLESLIAKRRQGIQEFFADYEQGRVESRYVPVKDITLPFADFSFDVALSSHYLFADLDDQDVSFHLKVIKELARVAKEVRIFPLIDRDGQPSPFLGPVLLGLQQENYGTEVREVQYALQQQGNAMLRVWAQQCDVSE
ncbi:class I SAM-dependent methyltransferase [Legionella yabuuchiae]|uniref:class I SAM-dependent methyltransferase n=1 Tax=Legionella yabuuchiae TaxID=376727 RepID=UPI00105660EB|nr:class I SAM-dependent methyltransferase [Legionella yabuuchiae]